MSNVCYFSMHASVYVFNHLLTQSCDPISSENYETKRKQNKSSSFSKEDEIRLLEAIHSEQKLLENKETNKVINSDKVRMTLIITMVLAQYVGLILG